MIELADAGQVYGLVVDGTGIVVGRAVSNVAQPGATIVTAEVYAAATGRIGRCTWDGTVLSDHEPPAPPAPARQQLGGTFLAAVADLGWWDLFDAAAAHQAAPAAQGGAGKPLDQRYWAAIGKADIVLATDAKLNRVARAAEAARVAASGQPAPDDPVITLSAVFDRCDALLAAGA